MQMLTMAMWQGLQNDSVSGGNTRWLMIFIGIVAVSMFLQTVFVVLTAVGAAKTQKRVLQIAEEIHSRATPIIEKAEDLVKETLPKIRTISDNLVETSELVKAKAKEFDSTLTEVNQKTKAQVARVDGMVSTALTATGALAEMIHKGIRTPVVEALGVVNAFKAGIDVLLKKSGGFANSASMRKKTAISLYKDDQAGM
jgi:hypothetical protein